MTTICVNNNTMYADGQMTGQHISSYTTKKIVNLGTAIVGGAGRWSHVVKFHQWVYENLLAEQAKTEHPYVQISMPEDMVDDDFLGLVLYQDGTVLQFEGSKDSYEVQQPCAIGSGADFAIACLHNGLSGEEAISTAIHFDTGSGGEIQVESFEDMEELTEEDIRAMSHDELLKLVLGEESGGEEEAVEESKPLCLKMGDNVHLIEWEGEVYDLLNDEHAVLFNLAKRMKIKIAHNIGTEKLRQRILDFLGEGD